MEQQRKAVHAIAQTGRLRTIIEHVTEMTATTAAVHFVAQHAEGAVRRRADGVFERLVKARPSRAAFELRLGREQRQVAAGTGEDALAMFLQKRARAGALGALPPQDLILLRRQLRAPFRIGLLDLEFLGGLGRRNPQPTEGSKAEKAGDRGEQNAAVNHDGLRRQESGLFAGRYAVVGPKLHRAGWKFLTLLRDGIQHRRSASSEFYTSSP